MNKVWKKKKEIWDQTKFSKAITVLSTLWALIIISDFILPLKIERTAISNSEVVASKSRSGKFGSSTSHTGMITICQFTMSVPAKIYNYSSFSLKSLS